MDRTKNIMTKIIITIKQSPSGEITQTIEANEDDQITYFERKMRKLVMAVMNGVFIGLDETEKVKEN